MNPNSKKIVSIVLPVIIALFSIFVLAKPASTPETYAKTIASLDEKKTIVMELTAASTAVSAAITLIPGDTATPIAEKLVDLSTYFLVVLCAIFLEKYMLTLSGFAVFKILIPVICILFAANVFWKNETCKRLMKKLGVLSLSLILIVPVSVKISDFIQSTYEDSINETISSAKDMSDELENEEDKSLWDKIKDGTTGAVKKVEESLNQFVEALAVLIVTSCIIPILVLVFFVWLMKMLLGMDGSLKITKRKNIDELQ